MLFFLFYLGCGEEFFYFVQFVLVVDGHEVDPNGGSVTNVRRGFGRIGKYDSRRVDTDVQNFVDFSLQKKCVNKFFAKENYLILLISKSKLSFTLDAQSKPAPSAARTSNTVKLSLHLTAETNQEPIKKKLTIKKVKRIDFKVYQKLP